MLGILYETYRPEMYYFEAIQMVFKVLLWTSLAMFAKGTVDNLVWRVLVGVTFVDFHVSV